MTKYNENNIYHHFYFSTLEVANIVEVKFEIQLLTDIFQARNEVSSTISESKSDKRDSPKTNIRNVQLYKSEPKKWHVGKKERSKIKGES